MDFEEFQYIKNGIKYYVERKWCPHDTYGNGHWERRESALNGQWSDWEIE